MLAPQSLEIQMWPIDRLVLYARNPRKNDAVVDRMCSSIREFGFKIPVLARSDGEVVDGHLRLKAAHKLRLTEIPVILCDEWTPAQVKACRAIAARPGHLHFTAHPDLLGVAGSGAGAGPRSILVHWREGEERRQAVLTVADEVQDEQRAPA